MKLEKIGWSMINLKLKGVGCLNVSEYCTFLRIVLLCDGVIELNHELYSDSLLNDAPNEISDTININLVSWDRCGT